MFIITILEDRNCFVDRTSFIIPSATRDLGPYLHHRDCRRKQEPRSLAARGMIKCIEMVAWDLLHDQVKHLAWNVNLLDHLFASDRGFDFFVRQCALHYESFIRIGWHDNLAA
jgi:hypothetical protein